jgi:hypothetical protein
MKNKRDKHPEETGPENGKPEKKKKLSLKQRLKEAFNGVSRKELGAIFKETLKDLRHPQEIGLLVGCTFIPGGWIGYGVYRVAKHRHKNPANDNPEQPGNEPGLKRADKGAKKGPKPPSP